ncbi:hypothetical protein D3C72_1975590 [compost metagenome]
MLLPRRFNTERYWRAPGSAAPENLALAGKRASVRRHPRTDKFPVRRVSGAGDRITATLWAEADSRAASVKCRAHERTSGDWRCTIVDGRAGTGATAGRGIR